MTVHALAKDQPAADRLLQRAAPSDYLQEWETYVGGPKGLEGSGVMQSLALFRIGREFLAVNAAAVGQVTPIKPIHRIPHQKGAVIRGLVNINGALRIVVAMEHLLDIGTAQTPPGDDARRCMLVLETSGDTWVFEVHEVSGIYHCDVAQLHNVPVNVSKSTANYLKGVFHWNGNSAGYLDDELLSFSLRKQLL